MPTYCAVLFCSLCPYRGTGSRRQLAESAWLASLGCSGGAQQPRRVHLNLIQLGFALKPLFWKTADFPSMHVENGWICPMAFGQARLSRPNWPQCAKAMPLGSPPHQGPKIADFLLLFFNLVIFFCHFCAVSHILRLAYFLAVLAASGPQNPAWFDGAPLS